MRLNRELLKQNAEFVSKDKNVAPILLHQSLRHRQHYVSKASRWSLQNALVQPYGIFGDGWMHGPMKKLAFGTLLAAVAPMTMMAAAHASQLKPWEIWHQPAASPGAEAIISFDVLTFWIITPITLFVTALLAYVMWRFRASANPVPSKTTHNTLIEVIWTLGPVAILLFLAIPSFQLLTSQFNPPKEPTVTIKATANQWYWGYEYQDDVELSFESRPIGVKEIAGSEEAAQAERVKAGKEDLNEYPRLLAVDNELVVPVGEVIRVLVTSNDVIHNFAMPAFGLKMDGYAGRTNEVFFQPMKEGLYYGQCSELCGKYHAYMPIAIRVVSEDDFAVWLDTAGDSLDAAYEGLQASLENKNKVAQATGKSISGN